jgi:hypothetical protein
MQRESPLFTEVEGIHAGQWPFRVGSQVSSTIASQLIHGADRSGSCASMMCRTCWRRDRANLGMAEDGCGLPEVKGVGAFWGRRWRAEGEGDRRAALACANFKVPAVSTNRASLFAHQLLHSSYPVCNIVEILLSRQKRLCGNNTAGYAGTR